MNHRLQSSRSRFEIISSFQLEFRLKGRKSDEKKTGSISHTVHIRENKTAGVQHLCDVFTHTHKKKEEKKKYMNSLSLLPLGAFSIVPCVCEPWGVRDASHSFLLFFVLLKRRVRPTPFCVVVVVSNIILYIPPHVDRATTVKCIVVWWWLYSSWLSCCVIKVQSEIRASAISWLNTLFVWLYMCRVVSWNPTLFFFSTGRLCVYSRRRSSSPLNSSNHWTLYFIFFFFFK